MLVGGFFPFIFTPFFVSAPPHSQPQPCLRGDAPAGWDIDEASYATFPSIHRAKVRWPAHLADLFNSSVQSLFRTPHKDFADLVFCHFLSLPICVCAFFLSFFSELPSSGVEVYVQLSCMVTLMAWVMSSLFNMLAVSRLSLGEALAVGASLSVV